MLDDSTKEDDEKLAEKFKPLTEYLQKSLSDFVEKVVISNRLTKSPCAIVASEYGISGTMEKLMQAQALGGGGDDFMRNYYLKQKKIFEINPVSEETNNSSKGSSHHGIPS
jgi:heat shock protein beta